MKKVLLAAIAMSVIAGTASAHHFANNSTHCITFVNEQARSNSGNQSDFLIYENGDLTTLSPAGRHDRPNYTVCAPAGTKAFKFRSTGNGVTTWYDQVMPNHDLTIALQGSKAKGYYEYR